MRKMVKLIHTKELHL